MEELYNSTPLTKAKNFSPLMHAVMATDWEQVQTIIETDPSQINHQNSIGMTAFFMALRNIRRNIPIMKKIALYLIENGADIDLQDNHGWTPLMVCIHCWYHDDNHINDDDNYTPYQVDDLIEIAELLIERGANINLKHFEGYTILTILLILNYLPENTEPLQRLMRIIIEYGADINGDIDESNYVNIVGNPLLIACDSYARYTNREPFLHILLNANPNINVQENKHHLSALFFALGRAGRRSSPDLMQILIQKGINLELKNINGRTVLQYCCKNNLDIECIKILLQNGANANTSIYFAIRKKNHEVVNLLLSFGADPLHKCQTGQFLTLLEEAIYTMHTGIIKSIVEAGAYQELLEKDIEKYIGLVEHEDRKQEIEGLLKTLKYVYQKN